MATSLHGAGFSGHRGGRNRPALDPAIAAYRLATGIKPEAADRLNLLLRNIRASGVEPLHLWVGGSDYNIPNQRKSIIGGDATIVNSGTAPVAASAEMTRFNNGQYFQFPMPAELISSDLRSTFAIMVWYKTVGGTVGSVVLSAYDTNVARGFTIEQANNTHAVSATVAYTASTISPAWRPVQSQRSLTSGDRCAYLARSGGDLYAGFDYEITNRGALQFYNGNSIFYLGGKAPVTESFWKSDMEVHAVLIGRGFGGLNLMDAPYRAGTRQRQNVPVIVAMGDSTTVTKWPLAMSDSENRTKWVGGAWADQCVIIDMSMGGTSLDAQVATTNQIVANLRLQGRSPSYFIYTPEDPFEFAANILGISAEPAVWYAYIESWLKSIEAATGCIIVCGSYIRGNNSLPASYREAERDFVLDMATRNGWGYLPFWEDPHSKVATDGVTDPNGFYADAIHQTNPGREQQAEIVAATLVHPYDTTTPRADMSNPPVVTGTLGVGNVLSCTTGSWFNSPTSYTYQWLRALSPISGATASTYTQVAADQGKWLSCRVSAVKTGLFRQPSYTSDPVGPVP